MAASYGGIDLGGTKIQAVIVDERSEVLGQARRPTPTEGSPEDVAEAMAQTVRDAAKSADLEPAKLGGIGVGSPGVIEDGDVSTARNLPDWEGTFALAKALEGMLGPEVRVGNDVQVATDAEFKLGAGQPYESLIGVFWGTGVGAGLILDGKPWLGLGGAGEIGHMVVEMDGARCTCGRRGCSRPTPGARRWRSRRASSTTRRAGTTDLFKLIKEHERTRLTSGVWEGARPRGQARNRADRARDQGARRRHCLGDQPARRPGRDHRRRARRAPRRPLRETDQRSDAAAPVRRRPSPGRPRGGARRSRRGDRGRIAPPE